MSVASNLPRVAGLVAVMLAVSAPSVSISHAGQIQRGEQISYEDRSEILDLIARYGQYFDSGNGEAYASLFTEDGELNYPGEQVNGPRGSVKGRKSLSDFAAGVGQRRGLKKVGIHHLGNTILVKVAPDRMRARTPVLTGELDATRTYAAAFNGYGVYEDDLVKTADGWRFQKRTGNIYGALPVPPEFLPAGVGK